MSVREFDVVILRDAVEELCGKLACVLPDDIRDAIEQALEPVSYTHLDVYKRQTFNGFCISNIALIVSGFTRG